MRYFLVPPASRSLMHLLNFNDQLLQSLLLDISKFDGYIIILA